MGQNTIGIPRALFYYYLFPLWERFFKELGFKVVLSPKTNKNIVNLGVQRAIDEVCYPIKIYYGHVASLIEQVDYIFLPRLISIEKRAYICPKFMGLPDMIKASFPDLPEIIEQNFDGSRNPKGVYLALKELGHKLGFTQKKTREASKEAFFALAEYERKLQAGFTPIEILERHNLVPNLNKKPLQIGLLGHGYNIYDQYISMNIIQKIRNLGAGVLTPEMLEPVFIDRATNNLAKHMFWTLGRKALGSALHLEKEANIVGIIYVTSFGCGPDSMVAELIEGAVRRQGQQAFLHLTIDEHTGEAGLDTRLEAFMDMIIRRKTS